MTPAATRSWRRSTHVNQAVAAHRVAAAGPACTRRVARPGRARAARLRKRRDELVEGAWDDASMMPPEHGRAAGAAPDALARGGAGRHSHRAAARASGRARSCCCARGWTSTAAAHVEAALQVRVAVRGAAAELHATEAPDAAVAAAGSRLPRGLSRKPRCRASLTAEHAERARDLVTELERVVRRRRYAETD